MPTWPRAACGPRTMGARPPPPCGPVHSGARDSGARLASPFIPARGTRAPALRPRSFGRAGLGRPPCVPVHSGARASLPRPVPPPYVHKAERTVLRRRPSPQSELGHMAGRYMLRPSDEPNREAAANDARRCPKGRRNDTWDTHATRRDAGKGKGGGMPRLQRAPKAAGTDQGEGTRPASRRPT